MTYRRLPVSWRLFVFLMLATSAFAQFSGSVQGTVLDPSGAAVPKAQMDVTNLDTGVAVRQTSDASGNFRFNSLAQDAMAGERAGFASEKIPLP